MAGELLQREGLTSYCDKLLILPARACGLARCVLVKCNVFHVEQWKASAATPGTGPETGDLDPPWLSLPFHPKRRLLLRRPLRLLHWGLHGPPGLAPRTSLLDQSAASMSCEVASWRTMIEGATTSIAI